MGLIFVFTALQVGLIQRHTVEPEGAEAED